VHSAKCEFNDMSCQKYVLHLTGKDGLEPKAPELAKAVIEVVDRVMTSDEIFDCCEYFRPCRDTLVTGEVSSWYKSFTKP